MFIPALKEDVSSYLFEVEGGLYDMGIEPRCRYLPCRNEVDPEAEVEVLSRCDRATRLLTGRRSGLGHLSSDTGGSGGEGIDGT